MKKSVPKPSILKTANPKMPKKTMITIAFATGAAFAVDWPFVRSENWIFSRLFILKFLAQSWQSLTGLVVMSFLARKVSRRSLSRWLKRLWYQLPLFVVFENLKVLLCRLRNPIKLMKVDGTALPMALQRNCCNNMPLGLHYAISLNSGSVAIWLNN